MKAGLVVIGAGPAGAAAALEAARGGLDTVLLDEAPAPGGQIYRDPGLHRPRDRDARHGNALRRALAASPVRVLSGRRVWSVNPGFRVDAIGPAGPETIEAPSLIAATGALERVVPFPGWTLPGVIGLAAATALMKGSGMAPGRRVVVAGCGPLLLAVAAKLAGHGIAVPAVLDLSSPAEWAAALPRLAARPSLLAQGAGWAATLARRRVPVLFRHGVRRAEGDGGLRRLLVGPVDDEGRPVGDAEWIEADALCIGHGLVPAPEIPRLLHAPHRFDPSRGGWVPVLDAHGRTGIPGLYAAGDGAGIAGALPARIAGQLAGRAAVADAGQPVPGSAKLLRSLRRSMRFADAVASLIRPRPAMMGAIPPETIVCRCEDVTRSEIEAAIAAGAAEVNQVKHFTRCGMGPCQGRMCAEAAAELVALHAGGREHAGTWSMRPPLRPIPLDALVGRFDYADIPVPQPAPL